MRSNLENTSLFGSVWRSGKLGASRTILAGNYTIISGGPIVYFLDANGSTRNVVLPTNAVGLTYFIFNVGGSGTLSVRTALGVELYTLAAAEGSCVVSSESEWGFVIPGSAGSGQPLDDELTALAGLTSAANKFPYFTGSGTAALADLSANMRTFLTTPSAANLATLLSDDVFALSDVELGALAGLTSAADKLPYFTGSGAAALADFSAFGRTLVDDATAAAAVTTLGLDNNKIATIGITIDGGGAVISTGVKGFIEVPYACTINRATLLGDQSGSIVIDIWKDTYANYPPTVADTIVASAPPTISAATKSQDSTLTGWTTSVAAGDILGFNVNSCATITRAHLILKVTKT